MKSPFFFLLTFSFCLTLSAQDQDFTQRLQTYLNQGATKGEFAGATAGFSIGDTAIVATAGYRNTDTEAPFERQTLSRIASISKSMTAVAALQLHEQGLLNLEATIDTYLPDYPQQHASRITTRHLLQHSSGISAYLSGKEAESKVEYASLTEAATAFQDRELLHEPGTAEYYTTYGYVVLGMVIEAVSGMSFEAYMQTHIWDVAGMAHTGVEHLSEQYDNKSTFYTRSRKGRIKTGKTNNLSNRIPGGGFYSTVDDLLRFGQAVLDHRLLSAETFAMMMEPPGLPYDGNPYGMGWFLYGENPKVGQVYGHGGEQTGCAAQLMILPEANAVVVVMSNTSHAMNYVFSSVVGIFQLVDEMREN